MYRFGRVMPVAATIAMMALGGIALARSFTFRPFVAIAGTLPDNTTVALSLDEYVSDGVRSGVFKRQCSLELAGKVYEFPYLKPVMKPSDVTADHAVFAATQGNTGIHAPGDIVKIEVTKRPDGKYDEDIRVYAYAANTATNPFKGTEYPADHHSGVVDGLVQITP